MAENNKRGRIWVEPSMQVKYIAFNAFFLAMFALVISGGIYLGIWMSVTKEFSEVRLNEELQTVTRIREYEAVRTRQAIEIIPFMKEEAKMLSQHQKNVLNKILINTNKKLIPLFAALFIFVAISSLVLSHRFVGPLYRIKKNLNAVSEGDLTANFALRRKDELKDLASDIESSVAVFSSTIAKVNEKVISLRKAKSEEEKSGLLLEIEQALSPYKTQRDK